MHATAPMPKPIDAAIQGHAAAAGQPVHTCTGAASAAAASICAAIARAGRTLALTAAFQLACRAALSSAAATSMPSIQSQKA